MAPPPKSYKPEPGAAVCGETWWKSLTVTGEIPHSNSFGADETAKIDPIGSGGWLATPNHELARAGWLEDWETSLREAARERVADIDDWRNFYAPPLTGPDQQSLRWLLDKATDMLDQVLEIYDRWTHRDGGSWPLTVGDETDDFPPYVAHNLICMPGYSGPGSEQGVRCPSFTEKQQRPVDRKKIKNLIRDALRHIRCAEFSMHKTRLMRDSMAALDELPNNDPHKKAWHAWIAKVVKGAFADEPSRTTVFGKCNKREIMALMVSEGLSEADATKRLCTMDYYLPDPSGLGEGEVDVDDAPAAPEEKKTDVGKVLLVGGGALGLALILRSMMR